MRRVALLVLLVASSARADDPAWARGVTADQKQRAHVLLDAGNALFLEHRYAEALDKYREAVASWDHPAIRFNIVRCLIQLDRSVEASDDLDKALAYGAAPLEQAVYAEALAYQKLLANQIGHVAVRCTQAGTKVSLDGQPMLTCPGSDERRVTPGPHQVVGTRDGFLTKTTDLVVVGGKREEVAVSLEPLAASGRIEHRYPTWIPWVVFGGGVATGAVGGLLEAFAASRMSDYNSAIARDCPHSCKPVPSGDTELATSARHYNLAAVTVMAVGGAATAAGIALLYINRGRTVYHERVVPVPVPGGAALTLTGAF